MDSETRMKRAPLSMWLSFAGLVICGLASIFSSQLSMSNTTEDGLLACFFALMFVLFRFAAKDRRGYCIKLDLWILPFFLAMSVSVAAGAVQDNVTISLIAGAIVGAAGAYVSIRAARPFGIPREGAGPPATDSSIQ